MSVNATEPARSTTTVEGLRLALEELGLNTKGQKQNLKQRLRKALKKQEQEANKTNQDEPVKKKQQPYDYYLFFDVEATCEKGGGFTFPNEIIEFPVILVDGETFEIVDEFRSYVKPTVNPKLSKFCTELTGITQEMVDVSPTFVEVLNSFQEFMAKHELYQTASATFVTDGPFDIRDFISKQCVHSGLKTRPAYFSLPWVNIRKLFREFYKQKENKNINMMLSHLNMEFQGREHSGLDDARNLAAIGKKMHEQGCIFKTNCKYDYKNRPFHHQQIKNKGRRR